MKGMYESKNGLILVKLIYIVIGVLSFVYWFLFPFLDTHSFEKLFFTFPLVFILLGFFFDNTKSRIYIFSVLAIIIFQVLIWLLASFFIPFQMSIGFIIELITVVALFIICLAELKGRELLQFFFNFIRTV